MKNIIQKKGGGRMSKYNLPDNEEYENDNEPIEHHKKHKDKKKYTQQELKDLMGVHRDVYKRKNRRVRRK